MSKLIKPLIIVIIFMIVGYWILPNKNSEETSGISKPGLIKVFNIEADQTISSPLVVRGEARGYWYFEGSFPLILTDWDGRIIAQSYASAQGEWMTEEMVPFEGKIEFENPEDIGEFSRRGALIFKKDNPSGLPEHDDALEVAVHFE